MKKKLKFIIITTTLFLLAVLLSVLSIFNWSEWEYLYELKSDYNGFSIIIYASYPPLPPNEHFRIKVLCVDDAGSPIKDYGIYDFSVPKENIEWFVLNNINGNTYLIVNSSHDKYNIPLNFEQIL